MKKTLRFTSAALTLALAAGMALPAFAAAKPSFSKDETVYAVMAPDGSVTSTTVSAHLYNAAGLSGVTDRSTLTDIVNTESDAAFTQNGDSLTWETTDTDVYYKGNTSRALPVSAAVTYTLDGETSPLENLLGKSGHLTIRIDLTNNETGTVTVNGAERTVVTPFITAVGVVLGEDASNVTLEHGLLESAAKSTVAAFVTLPGVRGALSGLLPDSFSAAEDYLQDSVTVEADVENLSAPQILLASAASAEALGQDNVFDLSSIHSLTDGISQLNDAMQQLLSGASQLVDGVAQLDSGAVALLDGTSQLNSGLDQLTEGLDTLTSNNAALTAGAQQVAKRFKKLYEKKGPKAATNYFYKLCIDSNYIRTAQIAKNIKWVTPTQYGDLEITINLTKPEKDPKAIAAAKLAPQSAYPKCQLCVENEGYAGRMNHPARENHRIIPLTINDSAWNLQYSPYVYYNEHCIVFNGRHVPMKIDRSAFDKLLDFVTLFPHYFVGSNADLPIVGGSILSHEHFQGGHYCFAMEKAPVEREISFRIKKILLTRPCFSKDRNWKVHLKNWMKIIVIRLLMLHH